MGQDLKSMLLSDFDSKTVFNSSCTTWISIPFFSQTSSKVLLPLQQKSMPYLEKTAAVLKSPATNSPTVICSKAFINKVF